MEFLLKRFFFGHFLQRFSTGVLTTLTFHVNFQCNYSIILFLYCKFSDEMPKESWQSLSSPNDLCMYRKIVYQVPVTLERPLTQINFHLAASWCLSAETVVIIYTDGSSHHFALNIISNVGHKRWFRFTFWFIIKVI